MSDVRPNQESRGMTDNDRAIAKRLYMQGFAVNRIAGLFDVNQGRIAELAAGTKDADILPDNSHVPSVKGKLDRPKQSSESMPKRRMGERAAKPKEPKAQKAKKPATSPKKTAAKKAAAKKTDPKAPSRMQTAPKPTAESAAAAA